MDDERVAGGGLRIDLADPAERERVGRRYRSLFLGAAEADPSALEEAGAAGLDEPLERRRRLAERFLRGFDEAELAERQPPATAPRLANTSLVFCPGLLNGLLPVSGFGTAFPYVEGEYGMRVLAADAHPLRGCEANVADLAATLEQGLGFDAAGAPIPPEAAVPPRDVVLLGYSKGLPDALHLLVRRPDLARKVRAVVGWAGAFGGSFLADDFDNQVEDRGLSPERQETLIRWLAKPFMPGVVLENISRRGTEYSARDAMQQLTTRYREQFWEAHRAELEALGIAWFYINASTTWREMPFFHLPLTAGVTLRDRDNDMQLTRSQATIQARDAVHLAAFHADHWDIAYDAFPEDVRFGSKNLAHRFARRAAIAALVLLLAELGLID
jgi:hypothetical protein